MGREYVLEGNSEGESAGDTPGVSFTVLKDVGFCTTSVVLTAIFLMMLVPLDHVGGGTNGIFGIFGIFGASAMITPYTLEHLNPRWLSLIQLPHLEP